MPKLGGLAIYVAFVTGVISSYDYNNELKGILIGSTIIMVVGLIDDIAHLRASVRLIFQIIASLIVVANGVVLTIFPWTIVNIVVTVIGIIGITNALNFLDNMDGLAAGIAAICCFGITAIAYKSGQRWLVFLALSLLGSCVGFLRYNFKPARIFMGDSGSTFLGFTLASMCVMCTWSNYTMVSIAVPILILGIMIFDTTMISILRIAEDKVHNFREWLEHADTDHVSHRLVHMGLSERETVMFLYICTFILVAVAISIPPDGVKSAALALSVYVLAAAWGIRKLHMIKTRAKHKAKAAL
jgi:UDP-GlcNAc:undecaprenyl-phosphate GlcNAc-1-phosphate transferase